MKEYFSLKQSNQKEIINKIKKHLYKKDEIIFAFVYGSFLYAPSFRDIDIGVYIRNISPEQVFDFEMKLEKFISEIIGIPFDIIEIKVLNFAPLSFLSNVFSRGRLLFSKDKQLLSNLIENASLEAISNEYIAQESLKELIPV